MKFSSLTAIAVFAGVSAAEATYTTTCNGCPSHSSAPDIVTRSDLPTSSCTDLPLTVISHTMVPSGSVGYGNNTSVSIPSASPPDVPAGAYAINAGGVSVLLAVAVGIAGSIL